MTLKLTPCSGCSRHVKQGECMCPFCGSKVECAAQASRAAGGRMSRAAMFAAGAVGMAVGTAECATTSATPAYGGFFPVDGGGAVDTEASVDQPADAAPETGNAHTDGGQDQPTDDAATADSGGAQTDDAALQSTDGAAAPDAAKAPDATDGAAMPTADAAKAPDASDGGRMVFPLYGGGFPPLDASARKDGNAGD